MDAYKIVREIGVGSFGSVLLVHPNSDPSELQVLKQIPISKLNQTPGSCNEIEILSNLLHPNIIGYKGFFQDHGNLYIGMEFCELGDLAAKIAKQRSSTPDSDNYEDPAVPDNPEEKSAINPIYFAESQVWVWFLQICLGLSYVHEKQILHRDLKAQNILISKDGTIKIADFGIARSLSEPDDFARTQIGTPYYLSPEIVENMPYDAKTDIWALGCLLYELCALRHPFTSKNMKILLYRILKAAYPPLPDSFSRFMTCLCAKLLNLSPNKRPSANQILRMGTVGKLISIINEFIPNDKVREELARHVSASAPLSTVGSDETPSTLKYRKKGFVRRGSEPTREIASRSTTKASNKVSCKKCNPSSKVSRSDALKTRSVSVSSNLPLQNSERKVRNVAPLKGTKNSTDSISSLTGMAEGLKAKLEAELGEEGFRSAYRGLIVEGRWGQADSHYLSQDPGLPAKFRELLLLECANQVVT